MIVPSIDLMGGNAVQLIGGKEKALDAGDPRPIAETFKLAGEIAVVDLDAALGRGSNTETISDLISLAPCRVGGGIRSIEAAQNWLDAGATKVVLGTAATPQILKELPPERVIVALDAHYGQVVVEGWTRKTGRGIIEKMRELKGLAGGFLVTFVEREGRLRGTATEQIEKLAEAAGDAKLTIAGGITTGEEIAKLDELGIDAQVGMALYTKRMSLAEAISAPLRSDRPDGLWATVICDTHGVALGLAWSNLKSLEEAVRTQKGVYHSRSRGLWIKGKTSGSTQDLIRVDLDCDRDAIRFIVRQHGAGFCHRGSWTCWGRDLGLPIKKRKFEQRKPRSNKHTLILRRIDPSEIDRLSRRAIRSEVLAEVTSIIEDVRIRGVDAVVQHAIRLGDLKPGDPWLIKPKKLNDALNSLPSEQRDLLERCANRIRVFAKKQKDCLIELEQTISGGQVGHTVRPVFIAGCYVPGGRFPLPSSVLMTTIPARVAGVESIWVASPRPSTLTMAACSLAGVDGLLSVGGAQAIAAMSFGMDPIPACDMLVGPGNAWVTAAKHIVSRHTGIDMLAGPSELLIITDASADPILVAADLLAQAEHDPLSLPMLISTSEPVIEEVEYELMLQLSKLPDPDVARAAFMNGFCVLVSDLEKAALLSDRLAPEHLQLFTKNPDGVAVSFRNYGALFIGSASTEVLGDYAAGPNHVLPTGGLGRNMGGLSVLSFLKVRTWLRIDDPTQAQQLYSDAAHLAQLEGLEAHAEAARLRQKEIKSLGI